MSGYLSSPAISENHLAFVCEDALWMVERGGGVARRMTSGAETVRNPCFSTDGAQLLFESDFEGVHQIYSMSIAGGVPSRITHAAVACFVVGCRPGGGLIYRSSKSAPVPGYSQLYEDPLSGAEAVTLPVGRAVWIDFCDDDPQRVVLGLNQVDNARWKRYRGGTAGDIWVGDLAQGQFHRLFPQHQPNAVDSSGGNPVLPTWCGDRIYFLDDRDGSSNLWSCNLDGSDFQKHTAHHDFYLRRLRRHGQVLVYQRGAQLFQFDTQSDRESKIDVEISVGGAHLQRKFITIDDCRQYPTLRADHKRLAVCSRGKLLQGNPWGGAVLQPGALEGVRYRLPTWLEGVGEGAHPLLVVSDAAGEEALELYDEESCEPRWRHTIPEVRRYEGLLANPCRPGVVVSDVGGALIWVDFSDPQNITHRQLDRARQLRIADATWSADGRWLAYVHPTGWLLSGGLLHLYDLDHDETHVLNDDELPIHSPAFDPDGRFLYCLSERTFDPMLDVVHFAASIRRATRLYAFVLSASEISPFDPRWPERLEELEKEKERKKEQQKECSKESPEEAQPKSEMAAEGDNAPQVKNTRDAGAANDGDRQGHDEDDPNPDPDPEDDHDDDEAPVPVEIDVAGLRERLVEFPSIPSGVYSDLQAAPGKVLFLAWPEVSLLQEEDEENLRGTLRCFDFKSLKVSTICGDVRGYEVQGERTLFDTHEGLRILKTGEETPDEAPPGYNTISGWIDDDRFCVEVVPAHEWRQMFHEAWRMQRDRFWTEDMAGVDWLAVRERYLPLVECISTRAELSDLIWELQGELGTSHAYEMGGDYPSGRYHPAGLLGADFAWDGGGYRIERILMGDCWRREAASPLAAPGVDVQVGDRLVSINGRSLSDSVTPTRLLMHRADVDVALVIERQFNPNSEPSMPKLSAASTEGDNGDAAHDAGANKDDSHSEAANDDIANDGAAPVPSGWRRHTVTVRPLTSERALRYRDWIRRNRAWVAEKSQQQLGYLHVPDMGGAGMSEFFRAFRSQAKFPGLIVDFRHNGGGFVSTLIVDYLRRQVIGYDRPRYGQVFTYPEEAVRGPIVGIIDQFAGSDGDIVSHAFKAYGIGPLVGKRTWGGVIGINVDAALADGTIVTQPEFATYFPGVGWGLENYGVDPDIEVEWDPVSFDHGEDPQLARAVDEALDRLKKDPVVAPKWPAVPHRGR